MSCFVAGFLKITWKKVLAAVSFPFTAVLIVISAFIFDEVLGPGSNAVANGLYSLVNYFYVFIFLPLTFVDVDFVSSVVFKVVVLLTFVWWYFLGCVLVFLLEKWRGKE